MSVEQVVHELQEQLQRVSAGHQAMHQELTTLRSMVDTRSRVWLVEPKTFVPDWFGKKNGPSWRTWSYLARDFIGVVHVALEQAMKVAENQKQTICDTPSARIQRDKRDGPRIATFLDLLEGEALEIV